MGKKQTFIDLASDAAIQLVIKEKEQQEKENLYGLKINARDLGHLTIHQVVEKMKIKGKYVIGYDVKLSEKEIPHYHIHFSDYRSFTALQSQKKRQLKGIGNSCKLMRAKEKEESDPNHWYGYAIKENEIFISTDLDCDQVRHSASIQAEVKKLKLDNIRKYEKNAEKKLTTIEKLFTYMEEKIKVQQKEKISFFNTLAIVTRYFIEEEEKMVTIQRAEQLAFRFFLQTKRLSYERYIDTVTKFRDFEI